MLEGVAAGLILSLTLFSGTVRLAKVGCAGTQAQVLAVAAAFALSQLAWLAVAIPGLMLMTAQLAFVRLGMHWFAAFVLGYMALKFFRTRPVVALDDAGELPEAAALFRYSFNRALAMPMRLPAAMAVLLATGVYVNHPASWATVPSVLLGALLGVCGWWGQFALLATFFVKRVPARVTLKSLNKIRPFGGLLYCVLGVLALLFLA